MTSQLSRILRLARCVIINYSDVADDEFTRFGGSFIRKITTTRRDILSLDLRAYDVVLLNFSHLFYNTNILENVYNKVIIYYGCGGAIDIGLSHLPRYGG